MKCQALKMFLFVCIQFLEVKHHGICNEVLIKNFQPTSDDRADRISIALETAIFLSMT